MSLCSICNLLWTSWKTGDWVLICFHTGLSQSSLVSPIAPIVHSKAPKPKVFGPLTLLVSKTPATRGTQFHTGIARCYSELLWDYAPLCSDCYKPSCHHLTTKRDREQQYHQAWLPNWRKKLQTDPPKSNGPKSNSHAGPWMFEPHCVVTISNKSAVSFRTYCHLVELVHLDPHPAV